MLAKNAQVRFVAIVTNGLLNHILELMSMLLIRFNFLQNVMLVIDQNLTNVVIFVSLSTTQDITVW